MKRWIAFCSVLFLLLLTAGCAAEPLPASDTPSAEPEVSDARSDVGDFSPPPTESIAYYTFEESVARATNIVEARCVERTFDGRNSRLRFEILSQLKGNVGAELTVVFPHHTYEVVAGEDRLRYSFSEGSCPYRPGMEYMLLLIEYDELYEPSVYYMTVSHVLIAKAFFEDGGDAAYIYGSQPAWQFSSGTADDFAGFADVAAYIRRLISENPSPGRVQKPDYIRSDDPAEILDGSPHFVRVRAEAFVSDYGYYAELRRCTVTETYKGGLAAEETEVLFLPGTVEAGGEYYLLLKERLMESLPYRLSSKHSLYEADDPAAEVFLRMTEQSE